MLKPRLLQFMSISFIVNWIFSSYKSTHGVRIAIKMSDILLCIVLCPKLGEFLPLISAKYAAPTPHRERGKDRWKNVNFFWRKNSSRTLLPRFRRFYLGETIEGTGRCGNRMGQGQGNSKASRVSLVTFAVWGAALSWRRHGRNRDVVLPESWRNFSITVVNWRQ